jgi:hypothetical protein
MKMGEDRDAPAEHETREMCCDIAPGRIAVCVPPSPSGYLNTPWCHLTKGHVGPHVCGEFKWLRIYNEATLALLDDLPEQPVPKPQPLE